jgi:hypothetical protein
MQHFSSAMSVRTEVTEAALADLLKEFKEIRDVTARGEEVRAVRQRADHRGGKLGEDRRTAEEVRTGRVIGGQLHK